MYSLTYLLIDDIIKISHKNYSEAIIHCGLSKINNFNNILIFVGIDWEKINWWITKKLLVLFTIFKRTKHFSNSQIYQDLFNYQDLTSRYILIIFWFNDDDIINA